MTARNCCWWRVHAVRRRTTVQAMRLLQRHQHRQQPTKKSDSIFQTIGLHSKARSEWVCAQIIAIRIKTERPKTDASHGIVSNWPTAFNHYQTESFPSFSVCWLWLHTNYVLFDALHANSIFHLILNFQNLIFQFYCWHETLFENSFPSKIAHIWSGVVYVLNLFWFEHCL